jgi:hypothetical protein
MHIDIDALHDKRKISPHAKAAKIVLLIVVFIFVLSVAIAIPVAAAGWRMIVEAQAGRTNLVAAAGAATRGDIYSANSSLALAQSHLAAADRFGKVLAPLEILPVVGDDVRGARLLVASSYKTANALSRLTVLGKDILDVLSRTNGFDASAPTLKGGVIAFFRLSAADRLAALKALDKAPADLAASVDEIGKALDGFNSLPDTAELAPIVTALRPMIAELSNLQDKLSAAAELSKLLPALSGYPVPKNYLLLFQNNTELRPTGGFIGTVGTVTIDAAAASNLTVKDVYALDANAKDANTAPPMPLVKYLSVQKRYLRDANWSPDFPTAAQEAAAIYGLESGNAKFDGVLAIDPSLAVDLLKIVGNITIGSSTFRPDNVTDEIEYQVEKGFDKKGLPVAQRKDILITLAGEVFARVMALPSDRWQLAVDSFVRALDEKHMLIASFDPTVAGFAASRNWDGALRAPANDFLMVVDANLAALKTDSVVSRTINYSFKTEGNGLTATVKLAYANHGGFSWKTTRYRDYARIFVPPGSELVSSSGAMANDKILDPKRTPGKVDVVDELGLRSFGAFVSVEPGETRELVFTYKLPVSIVSAANGGYYRLNVQKQSGTFATPLTLSLNFGKKVASAEPAEPRENWGDGSYNVSTDLIIDREFKVEF